MPKVPAAVYAAPTSTSIATSAEADQASAPGYAVGLPPQYQEQPVVR
jgi:hypothetical protein